ncbi:MAG: hypothetical protein EHM78_02210 [Myxococcaceae bacterium]|nr:MAG: hypothetical protein EHM78_02210 [Myxococcaceae bacterium]
MSRSFSATGGYVVDDGPRDFAMSGGFFSGEVTTAAAASRLKVWNDTSWSSKPSKVWDGVAWITKPVRFWNGTAWV